MSLSRKNELMLVIPFRSLN